MTETNVSTEHIQIERIVSEVIRRLSAVDTSVGSDPAPAHLPGKVVTAESIESLPAECRAVSLDAGAVLTPLAKDELKSRGITVQHASQPRQCTQILAASEVQDAVAQRATQVVSGGEVLRVPSNDQLVTRLNAHPRTGTRLALTLEPELVACHANRDATACVASVANVDAARRAAAMHPTGLALFARCEQEVAEMIQAFLNSKEG